MAVARAANTHDLADLNPSMDALYLLAAPSTPAEVIEAVAELLTPASIAPSAKDEVLAAVVRALKVEGLI
jgi:hypothetical protein